jgi:hypothetical protein
VPDIVVNTKTFFEVEPTLCAILVQAGIARYLVNVKAEQDAQPHAPAPPKVDTFTVETFGLSATPCIRLRRPDGSLTTFAGVPEAARTAFQTLCWSAREGKKVLQGPQPPDEIVAEYLRRWPQDAVAVADAKRRRLDEATAAQKRQSEGKRLW